MIVALGKLRDPRAVPILIRHLPEVQNRREMVDALGEIGDPSADGALLDSLRTGAVLPECVRTVVALDGSGGDLTFEELLATPGDRASLEAGPNDPAWLMYTSGTTGPPKGVLLTHRSLLAGCRHLQFMRPMLADDVFLTAFPLCHVAGYQVIVLEHPVRGQLLVADRNQHEVLRDRHRRRRQAPHRRRLAGDG